jgi:hypothetical protein
MNRQLYNKAGIASLDAGAPSIKYAGNIDPNKPTGPLAPFYEYFDMEKPKPKPESEQASAPDPMSDLYDQYLNMKAQGIIPMNMSFNDFKELLREQSSSEGGIMDMVPREQALFGGLKKAVKKVTGAVSDFAKSDVGKAALAGAAIYGLGGGTFFGRTLPTPFSSLPLQSSATGSGFGIGNILTNIGRLTGLGAGGLDLGSKLAGTSIADALTKKGTLGTLAIAGTSLLAGLSAADKEEIEAADPTARGAIVKEKLRQSLTRLGYKGEELETKINEGVSEYFGNTEGITKYAVGGRVKYALGDTASMASGIGGLPMRTNQAGVNEIDLRNTGGFIPPVGVKEKADDIPAMLSNNEFVFTADAVRAAGGGSVEKGAQRMYDLMKSLEGKIA